MYGVKRVMTEMIKSSHLHSLKKNKIPYKLNIGLSSVGLYGCTSEIVSSFRDSKHIIEVIRASCHLPIIGGILPYKVDGHCSRYYDGGVSMTFPDIENITNEKSFTITVDGRPIVNNIDIVPNIGFTIPPIWSYIPRKPHILRLFYKLGYLRAMQFLFSENNSSKISHVLRKQQDISKINMKDIKRQINMTILTIVNEK
jgi:predicted patatin/cPLA2 family phospholipase